MIIMVVFFNLFLFATFCIIYFICFWIYWFIFFRSSSHLFKMFLTDFRSHFPTDSAIFSKQISQFSEQTQVNWSCDFKSKLSI